MSDEKCKHERYTPTTKVDVVKMSGIEAWQMVLKVSLKCTSCGGYYTFHAKHGFSTVEPTINNDCSELRVPIDYPSKEDEEQVVVVDKPKLLH